MPRLIPRRWLGGTCRPCLSSAPKSRSMPSSATLATNRDSFQPAPDVGGEYRQSRQQGLVPNAVEAAGDVRIEQPCTCTGRSQCQMEGDDRVHRAPSRSEPIAVRLEACLPFGFQRHLDEHLKGSFADRRNAKGPRPAVRLRDMYPSHGLRTVVPEAQTISQPHPALGRPAHHAVDAGRIPARVLLGHPADREPFCGSGANQELLQVLHLPALPGCRGTVDPTLQSPHGSLHRSPINLGPRRLPSLAGLFGSHRLTSPAIQALHVFPTVETMAEVSPLSGWVSPRHRGPVRPITGRPSLAPPLLYPLRHPLPCGRDTAASQRRGEWGLPCCPMGKSGWGGCAL